MTRFYDISDISKTNPTGLSSLLEIDLSPDHDESSLIIRSPLGGPEYKYAVLDDFATS